MLMFNDNVICNIHIYVSQTLHLLISDLFSGSCVARACACAPLAAGAAAPAQALLGRVAGNAVGRVLVQRRVLAVKVVLRAPAQQQPLLLRDGCPTVTDVDACLIRCGTPL